MGWPSPILPRNLTRNLKISPWKRKFHLETIIFRFYVKFRGCIGTFDPVTCLLFHWFFPWYLLDVGAAPPRNDNSLSRLWLCSPCEDGSPYFYLCNRALGTQAARAWENGKMGKEFDWNGAVRACGVIFIFSVCMVVVCFFCKQSGNRWFFVVLER